uniref:XylR n=1 Tax=Geobacillus stearothermophilus TaxID=1422 RepID=O31397_GEOSE|nr:XylR [Geobacillus stearothermophilus]
MSMILPIAIMVLVTACSQAAMGRLERQNDSFVLVQGGSVKNTRSNFYGSGEVLADFYIGKYEVTQREWVEVMGSNPSQFQGDDLPVEMVSWYDVIEYCNQRSIKEGLKPFYNIDKQKIDPNNQSEFDPVKWTVTINPDANGYRLPTEAEWEYAAGGGQLSQSYKYSGSSRVDDVAWYWRNAGKEYLSGDWNWPIIESNQSRTRPVGGKEPNELGLYDMSGNVREWCWDWYGDEVNQNYDGGLFRVVKGGGWIGDVSSSEVAFRGKFEASGFGPDQGFRLARNK